MKNLLLLVICLTTSVHVLAGWVIDPEGSYVGFASVKNDLIAENHSFTQITGTIEDSGEANIVIALASVETLIPIRNERMQAILFEVAQYPDVTVTANLDLDEFTSLGLGESKTDTILLGINLHGTDLSENVLVKVTRSSDNSYEVTSLGPIVIHASQFALSDGLESLRKVAGLQSIDLMVPVTFDLRLVKIEPKS
ncbi:MAG: YceI family protein [Pseudomonadales bacterium]